MFVCCFCNQLHGPLYLPQVIVPFHVFISPKVHCCRPSGFLELPLPKSIACALPLFFPVAFLSTSVALLSTNFFANALACFLVCFIVVPAFFLVTFLVGELLVYLTTAKISNSFWRSSLPISSFSLKIKLTNSS